MAIEIKTATFNGIDGHIITVEIDITRGLPCFNIVGLADTSIKESKERVRSAIINSGFDFPINRITVNLAPADIRKEGSLFDLPIAIGVLYATNQIKIPDIDKYLFMGELSLSGELKKIRGALPIVIEGYKSHILNYIVPAYNAEECSIVKTINIYSVDNLKQVISFLQYKDLLPYKSNKNKVEFNNNMGDFSEVVGHESCKRGLEVASAGGHNVILVGPPGSGKTMLAKRLNSIVPELSYEEALEVAKVYSVYGKSFSNLNFTRPFRSPHHTITKVALVGGGHKLIPGEISLAHNGILFLDEILEFKKNILELLRQPLEDRKITISRSSGNVEYPANLMLVASLNPCPCGFYLSKAKECTCSDYERKRYINKLSGPLLDRIDLFMFVNSVSFSDLKIKNKSETSKKIKARVEKARNIQKNRFKDLPIYCNAQMNEKLIREYCNLDAQSSDILEKIYCKFNLSTRAYTRILKVSRTIADLNNRANIKKEDIMEAIQYRKFMENKII